MPTGIEQRRPSETDQLYKMTRAMNSSMSEAGASGEGRAVSDGGTDEQLSQHGSSATQRRALLDMLFFCSVGDVARVEEICKTWRIDVSDAKSCDYDKRYPIHLAASEGCFSVVDWLIKNKADVNVIDRFKHTPLEDAVRGDHIEVAKLLSNAGGMVMYQGKLVNLDHSQFAGYVKMYTEGSFENELEWEVDPSNINIGTVIGRGEFGTVYSARWHNTLVAVKVLKSTSKLAVEELKSELNALRKAHHPHTMQFLGACTSKEPYMIITEYMPAGSVADILGKEFHIGVRRSAEIALHTARGMAYLHERKPYSIIHRDLKPANIMIGSSPYLGKQHQREILVRYGVAKIADFGLSKSISLGQRMGNLANAAGGAALNTISERFEPDAGTPTNAPSYQMTGETGSYRYMAPEVFRHEPYNAKVDVYSFAMLCFELFEARAPFDRMDAVNVAKAVALEGNRPIMLALDKPNDPVRSELKALIERMWHSDPRARPDFTEVITGLTQLIRKVPRSTIQGEKACCAVQ
mmetsp:Transcript_40831/g.103449  ORF Transcript_40831/g.103449 Transcript_40831/m.103449 type:complete len:522 (+) Transcript_40831:168-1733(+)